MSQQSNQQQQQQQQNQEEDQMPNKSQNPSTPAKHVPNQNDKDPVLPVKK